MSICGVTSDVGSPQMWGHHTESPQMAPQMSHAVCAMSVRVCPQCVGSSRRFARARRDVDHRMAPVDARVPPVGAGLFY